MSNLKTFGKVARIIIGLAYLLIGSCIIIFGVGNGVSLGLDTISGLVFIVSTGLLGVVIINGGIKKLRDPTLEKHYASMSPEDIEKEKKKSKKSSVGYLITIVIIIIFCGVTFWALQSQTDLKNQEAMNRIQKISESFTAGEPIYKFELIDTFPIINFVDKQNNKCLEVHIGDIAFSIKELAGKETEDLIIKEDFRMYLKDNLELVNTCNSMEIVDYASPPARTRISLKLDYVNGRVTKVNNITSNLTD